MKFITLEEFHQQKLDPGGTLPLLIHNLKKLLDRLMPEVVQTIEGSWMKNLEKTAECPWLLIALDDQEHAVAVTIVLDPTGGCSNQTDQQRTLRITSSAKDSSVAKHPTLTLW